MKLPKPNIGESQEDFTKRYNLWRETNRKSDSIEDRAYSFIEIKSFDEEKRILNGIATTPTPDRMNDIVEPEGAKFTLPLAFLWQHDSKQPIGHVTKAKVTKNGIEFEAQLVKIDEPGKLKDRLDEAWQSIKSGLVRAVSIGFRAIEFSFLKETDGIRFTEWDWLELSAVTIPANVDASITQIKSYDQWDLSALGRENKTDQTDPGVSGKKTANVVVNSRKDGKGKMKTLIEQIKDFENTRAAKAARMSEILDKSGEDGTTLDEAQATEYDELKAELDAIDKHLVRLHDAEKVNAHKATEIAGGNSNEASQSRAGEHHHVVQMKNNLPKGTAFTRYAMALAKSQGNLMQAAEIAKSQWGDSTPEVELVLRAAVTAGTTTDANWASALVPYTQMASEFIELLRPQTIIGRVPGLRRVPFNISMPRALSGTSVNWVGEGKPKPLSKMSFDTVTLRWTKCAGIVVLTDELVRFSNPSAEATVRQDLIDSMAQFLDEDFVDPAKAVVANISPSSITNGVTPVTASGVTADALRADVKDLFSNMLSANLSPSGSVWIMPTLQAVAMTMMMNALGQRDFPDVTISGGTFFGLPVVLSDSVPAGLIILAKASEIFLADDGDVTLDASREASLQMDSAPTEGAQQLVSLWQNNMVALRAERYINWQRRRAEAVQYISGANYGGVTS